MGVIVWYLDLQLSMQSVPITINTVSLNPAQARLVVHRSSETSTNQSDVVKRSDDRFLYLVVDSVS